MVVIGIIRGTDQISRNGISEKDAYDAVLFAVGVVLVESYHDKCVVHEVLVGEEGFEEFPRPSSCYSHGSVMSCTP